MKSILFYDASFPYNGTRPADKALQLLEKEFKIVKANCLAEELVDADCLVNLHGPYFPKESWSNILSFLQEGKGLVHIGGAPFRIPVYFEDGVWKEEVEQTGYHQQLNIHEALVVDKSPIETLEANQDIPLFAQKECLFTIEETYGFTLHVTKENDVPHESGTGGPMDAHLYPLLKGVSKRNRDVAAPAVLLENTKGTFAGGRWLFLNQPLSRNFWNEAGVNAICEWTAFCADGVTEIWVKPNYATYHAGEQPHLTVQLQELKGSRNHDWKFSFTLEYEGKVIWHDVLDVVGSEAIAYEHLAVPIQVEPGFYQLTCVAESSIGETRTFHQGFWGFDKELLEAGSELSCDRDYFWKDGRPFPIVGMTYMTSDVARKYLFLPNVSVWDRDMAQMKKAGINYIRTGLWTAYRNVMFVDGHPYEEVLRAIDAFILTAKKHDIEVTFNFFSFTPESWEGKNPYLDPRSVEAQKRFITAVVSRHKTTKNIQWDLINEPSMFDPKRIFAGPRTAGDPYEIKLFREWLKKRHKDIRTLQEHWNMTGLELPDFSAAMPPDVGDVNFRTTPIQPKKGARWLDYTLFTMDMHNRWAKELTDTIKKISPNQLVTVGQDEALGAQRPSPFFYGEVVDYTTNHSWWLMDNLVWDGIFTKTPDKPNLIQETGIMYVERPDGRAKRSEKELRNILERKYAYAFSTGGAGAVQWIWNTNHYMDNVNESNIGALRSDQTEKPEVDVSYDFGHFMEEIRDIFVGRELEDVAVIFPYSNDFSNRKLAYGATTKLTRIFNYDLKLPFRAFGEYHLEGLAKNPPKLIIVPSAHNFSNEAFEALIAHVSENGGTLLWTGPIGLDEYWTKTSRLNAEIGKTVLANVLREERLQLACSKYSASFGGDRIADTEKEYFVNEQGEKVSSAVKKVAVGNGQLIWCPLPLELNNRDDVLVDFYQLGLEDSGVHNPLNWKQAGELPGIYGRKIKFEKGSLFIFVSEYSEDQIVEITDVETNCTYEFQVNSERTVMFATDLKGQTLATYRPDEVEIKVKVQELR